MKAYLKDGNLIIEAQDDTEAAALEEWKKSKARPIVNTHWYKVFRKQIQEITEVDLEQARQTYENIYPNPWAKT